MKELPIRLTPLALLLTVISICLTVLGILTYTTARADMNLAETYAETVRTRYELEARGQNWIGGLAASARESSNGGSSMNGRKTPPSENCGTVTSPDERSNP